MAIGDINDDPGLMAYSELLPGLLEEFQPDFVIANGENSAKGLGITPATFEKILSLGTDAVTLGNHTWSKKEILDIIDDERLVRPINYPYGTPGAGCRIIKAKNGLKIGVLNALGRENLIPIINRENNVTLECPFRMIDYEIEKIKNHVDLIVVDFHAESAIEKKSFGYYLDGRAHMIYGTHTHIQTADEQILPKGTVYITDIGMTGSYDSVVGIKKEEAIRQFCTQRPVKFTGATEDRGISGILAYFDDDNNFRPTNVIRIARFSKYQKQYNLPFEEIANKYQKIVSREQKYQRYISSYKEMNNLSSFSEIYSKIADGVSYLTNGLLSMVYIFDKNDQDRPWQLKAVSGNSIMAGFTEAVNTYVSALTPEKLKNVESHTQQIIENAFIKLFPLKDEKPENNLVGVVVVKLSHHIIELDIDHEDVKILMDFIKDSCQILESYYSRMIQKQQIEELKTLYDVSKSISASIELENLLDNIMALATRVLNSETSSILMLDEKTNELTFQLAQGDKGAEVKKLIRLKVGQGIAGWVAQTGEYCIVPDTSKDPRFYKEGDEKTKFVTKSLICVPLKHQDKIIGVLEVLNRKGEIPFNDHDKELLELVAALSSNPIVNAKLYGNIKNLYKSTLKVLANALDAKDSYTHGHSQRVAEYSVAIACELGFSQKDSDDLEFAALLHDIGKIGIRDNILCKPGKLTDEEFKIIQMHPVMSAQILAPIDFLADKIPIVKHHHERFDGKGYPSKLKGEEIPLGARIICVADTFDAMTSNRSYRKGLPAEVALEELKRCSGAQFDPVIVQAFLNVFAKKYARNFEEIRTKFEEQESVLEISGDSNVKQEPKIENPLPKTETVGTKPAESAAAPVEPEKKT